MKKIFTILFASSFIFFYSCNYSNFEKENEKPSSEKNEKSDGSSVSEENISNQEKKTDLIFNKDGNLVKKDNDVKYIDYIKLKQKGFSDIEILENLDPHNYVKIDESSRPVGLNDNEWKKLYESGKEAVNYINHNKHLKKQSKSYWEIRNKMNGMNKFIDHN